MAYDIRDFGARTDGTLCTQEIQAAIDAAFLAGGGEVTVPEGRFLTGGLRLRSRVTLHLLKNAVLLGSTDPEDYCTYLLDKLEPISEQEKNAIAPNLADASRSGNSATFDLSNHSEVQVTGSFNLIMSWSYEYGMAATVGANLILADGTSVAIASHSKTLWTAGSSSSANFDKTIDLSSYSAAQLASCKIQGYMNNVYCPDSGKRIEGTVKVTLVKGL